MTGMVTNKHVIVHAAVLFRRLFFILAVLAATAAPAAAAMTGERMAEELTCLPVNGYIQLPGILWDDLTPLAKETFNSNPAAVTNALFSLPMEEREDFITLYLEPAARERHRFFFMRCQEVSERRARGAMVDGRDVIPGPLRAELLERERVRLALHEGAIPFRIGNVIVYIPIPPGYTTVDTQLPGFVADSLSGSLAVFRKIDAPTPGEERVVPRYILATVKHVREGADNLSSLLQAYRIMVDADWRLTSIYPPEAVPGQAESVEYKWNLAPFNVRDNSFCYGQFEKTADFHGVEEIRYRTTAIVTLPGSYIQVSIGHGANTSLDMVNEMNTDLTRWRDAILTANWN